MDAGEGGGSVGLGVECIAGDCGRGGKGGADRRLFDGGFRWVWRSGEDCDILVRGTTV